ncbi:hypothetical protein TRVA0_072S00386 [Trichomonascus vanleenenianus]|uniref:proline--tRNA ligase n=1 Tax=Trichomonascus vanleenenianus TaxID=2268995 RepID=UPI003ECB8681
MSESLVGEFAKLTVTHGEAQTNEAWFEAVKGTSEASGLDFKFVKTAVFKPRVGKSQPTPALVVVSLAETNANGAQAAKAVGLKEARLAAPDFIAENFGEGIDPRELGPFVLKSAVNTEKIKCVLDAGIASEKVTLAVRSAKQGETAFLEPSRLLDLLNSTGVEVTTADFAAAAAAASGAAQKSQKAAPKPKKDEGKIEGAALIGITADKELDFAGWYQQVLTKGEMLDYYDISGCYVMRPASFTVWERIQDFFNAKIKSIGVKNCMFPMFVSERMLEKEKDHIEGFAPEVAWVTKAGDSDLEEKIAIRPTSETAMYPYFAKWIRSHRDLPLRVNQWNSVVRWEFKHPQPFLRSREFLWQEGHTAHLTQEGAYEEMMQILDWYAAIYEELLAVPVVKGVKTDREKFAGSYMSTTCEGYIPTTGRGIQGATSHGLGQNFSKMFDIVVENPEAGKEKIFVWQNSWGYSTRSIGVMVMVHSDNKGLVIPPRVADVQAVVIPVGLTAKTSDEDRNGVFDGAKKVEDALHAAGVRVTSDIRENYTPGFKFADWELKGVPLRLEFGPADMRKSQVTAVRRDNGEKVAIPVAELGEKIPALLEQVQADMLARAKKAYDEHIVYTEKLEDFVPLMNKKNVLRAPFCGDGPCEDDIKDRTTASEGDEDYDERAPSMGAKSLCIPLGLDAPKEGTKCVGCGKPAKYITQFGRSY